jgi:hypothetical protein
LNIASYCLEKRVQIQYKLEQFIHEFTLGFVKGIMNYTVRTWAVFLVISFNLFTVQLSAASELLLEANVEPLVSIVPWQKVAHIGNVGPNGISTSLPFYVTSNTSRVHINLVVTHLYKDGDTRLNVKLPVDESSGVEVSPLSARPMPGTSLHTQYEGTTDLNKSGGVFQGLKSATISLENTASGVLQETVDFSVAWLSDGVNQPSGTYQGYVVVTVSVE